MFFMYSVNDFALCGAPLLAAVLTSLAFCVHFAGFARCCATRFAHAHASLVVVPLLASLTAVLLAQSYARCANCCARFTRSCACTSLAVAPVIASRLLCCRSLRSTVCSLRSQLCLHCSLLCWCRYSLRSLLWCRSLRSRLCSLRSQLFALLNFAQALAARFAR